MDFFNKIEKTRDNLNKNENELLKYCIENSQSIKNMKIEDLSKRTFVSTASIIRFCKKLGFSGYSQFKNSLALTIESSHDNTPNTSAENPGMNIFDDIDKTRNMINETVIDEIVDLIYSSNRIDFFGEGSSRTVCEDMARRFRLVGKQTYYYDDTSIMYLSAAHLKANDLVFAISMSGETSQVLKAVNIAKTRGAYVISITNMSMNSISRIADKSLFVCSTRYSIGDMNFISRIPAFTLMEYIFDKCIKKLS